LVLYLFVSDSSHRLEFEFGLKSTFEFIEIKALSR